MNLMSLDKQEGQNVKELQELDVDLIVSGVRFNEKFKGKKHKQMIKKKNLDPYNNLQPKQEKKWTLMGGDAPKEKVWDMAEFKNSMDQTKMSS